jgi:leucyl/phenylalanyl-tRNA--protein transferase
VISNCQNIKRDGQDGTWITNDMIEAYCKLNELGIAKSIEVWQNEELVGGLYGIDLGHVFFVGKVCFQVSMRQGSLHQLSKAAKKTIQAIGLSSTIRI